MNRCHNLLSICRACYGTAGRLDERLVYLSHKGPRSKPVTQERVVEVRQTWHYDSTAIDANPGTRLCLTYQKWFSHFTNAVHSLVSHWPGLSLFESARLANVSAA